MKPGNDHKLVKFELERRWVTTSEVGELSQQRFAQLSTKINTLKFTLQF